MEKSKAPLTVLIVDDEPMLRSLFADAFADTGCIALEAENGNVALSCVRANPVDVIVSDIRMPGGSGLDLLKNLKAFNVEKPPVIFMTGYADAEPEQVYDLGAEGIFYKPFKQSDLVAAALRLAKPLAERWVEPRAAGSTEIELKGHFPSVEAALAAHQLGVGRGGIFFAVSAPTSKSGEEVKFAFTFQAGSFASLEGTGVVRWVRTTATDGRPTGVGIEIVHLTDSCRAAYLALESRRTAVAFIPSR